jgi:hypothetical protein
MPVKQVTVWPTEADFEADLQAVLRRAFPWLPTTSIRHQTKFSFTSGRSHIEVDGRAQSQVTARADVLLYFNEQPLAVLELKRSGQAIDSSDIEQGLSYARMMHPHPPLVVVTNSSDVLILETHTGKEWKPPEQSDAAFADLLKQATRVASEDLKRAIGTLMGSNPNIWVPAVRQTSALVIKELSANWDQQLMPFVQDFLIPRKATAATLYLLRQNKRLVLIEGSPLSGKSNVLRELTNQTADADDIVVLFVEADSGSGIYQGIADALSNALSWPISRNEARDWLLNLSKTLSPSLVIAVDELGIGQEEIRVDVEDLTSYLFGSRVRVVLAIDDSVADRLVMNSTGRKHSAIGRRASRIKLGPLDDDEFQLAVELLWQHRVSIMHGGQSSPELRIPWILRSVVSNIVSQDRYANEKLVAVLPPLLGLDLIDHTRRRFRDDELRRMIRGVAQAVLQDARDRTRPIGLILESMATFVVRRRTLLDTIEPTDMENLVQRGYLRPILHDSGEAIMVIRVPELVASEAAYILGVELLKQIKSAEKDAAHWLAQMAANIPLGDIVAAQSLLDSAFQSGSLPMELIMALIKSPPEKHTFAAGTKAAMYFPGAGLIDMTFEGDGTILLQALGQRHKIEPNSPSEPPTGYGNIHSWLILSHFAGCPSAIEKNGQIDARVDPMVLLDVGTCPIVLRAVSADLEMSAIMTHDIPEGEVVCEQVGIVEPITLSIWRYLGSTGPEAEDWLEEAVERNSWPLLMRLHIALDQLVNSANKDTAAFARNAVKRLIEPALSKTSLLH